MKNTKNKNKGLGFFSILGIILITILVSVGVTAWVINGYIFPKRFNPVVLSQKEERALDSKLKWFSGFGSSTHNNQDESKLTPEKYSEGKNKEIILTERELNSLLNSNTDLSDKLAIDLSKDLLSVKLLIPVDQDFPVIGGKTIKVSAGMELAFKNSLPIVRLKGVSVMGIPVPNAWLGGLKNIDLVKQYGHDEEFWKSFSDGVEEMRVEDGRFKIKLKE
ncbi:MAG: arginine N-succinyltransferase [Candidatus Brocadiaceae bacterium]|nr:arginine N-succinyltransferase [Candidatus Brocadiaceae bacterium]